MDSENTSALLERLNQEEMYRHIPIAVYLVLVGVTGLIGNSIVCFIYIAVYTQSNSRTFILCLAVIDLCTCIFDIPLEIVNVLNQYEFSEPLLCKFSRFGNSLTTLYSSGILLCIAIDRYLKICRPTGFQITKKTAIILCFVLFFVTFCLVWPAFLMYGVKSTDFKYGSITLMGRECSINDDFKDSKYPTIHTIIMVVFFVSALCLLIVLYSLIGRKVRFFAYKNERRLTQSNTTDSDDNIDNDINLKNLRRAVTCKVLEQNQYVHVSIELKKNELRNSNDRNSESTGTAAVSNSRDTLPPVKKDNLPNLDKPAGKIKATPAELDKIKRRRTLARNTTYLMFIVTSSFIIASLPHLVLIILDRIIRDWVDNMDPTSRVVYRFFLRSYFLGATVNPIIYSIFDRRFKYACRGVAKKIKSILCRCESSEIGE